MLERARAVRLGRKAGAGDSAVRDLHRYLAASTFTGQAQGERVQAGRDCLATALPALYPDLPYYPRP